MTTMDMLDTLASIAADLTVALSAKDRYLRLLDALHHIIPFDVANIFAIEHNSKFCPKNIFRPMQFVHSFKVYSK